MNFDNKTSTPKAKQTISLRRGRRGPYSSRKGNVSNVSVTSEKELDQVQLPEQMKNLLEPSQNQSLEGDKRKTCGKFRIQIIS